MARVRVVITDHMIGHAAMRVLNRELPELEEAGEVAPRLFRGDHVDMDEREAFEAITNERAVPADKDTIAAFEALRDSEAAEQAKRDEESKSEVSQARALASKAADAAKSRFVAAKTKRAE